MAIESPRVTADVVEANEFPDLSYRFQVSAVPKIVINDSVELLGSQREQRFLEAVLKAAANGGKGTGDGEQGKANRGTRSPSP